MTALITSTINPVNAYSLYSPAERLSQTIHTLNKLVTAGFDEIFLFDNSIQSINTDELLKACSKIKLFQSPQYAFKNKGLNEALLILNNIHHIPSNVPIFKISGRYYPTSDFITNKFNTFPDMDFIGKGYNFQNRIPGFSTKAYYVKNAAVLTDTLVLAVEEMVSFSKRPHGFRSFLHALKEIVKPQLGTSFQLSIEQSFARIIKAKYKYHLMDKMHIEGFEAGALTQALFSE